MQQQSNRLPQCLRTEIDRVALLCSFRAGWVQTARGVIAGKQLGFVSEVHNSSASLFEGSGFKLVYLHLSDTCAAMKL